MILKSCVIVIPVHKFNPTSFELISFQQCYKVLGNHPVKIVAPKGLNLDSYRNVVDNIDVVFIDPKWQSSLTNYNKLKLSRFFYRMFEQFEFMLTYELDAFVFKDELASWCEKGYDYIGAPWFEGYSYAGNRLTGVGNSGFSLRNIRSVQKVLKSMYYEVPAAANNDRESRWKAPLRHLYCTLLNQFGENYSIQRYCRRLEDDFFCNLVPLQYKDFTIAPIEQALKFSFEVKPEFLMELNSNVLPMGCHAWWRYNLPFWKPYIESFGYSL